MIRDDTPIAMLNVGELKGLLKDLSLNTKQINSPAHKRVVYGLKGICDLFSCGLSRAQELKRTVISEAVSQNGRTIVTDVDLALELFANSSKISKTNK